MPGIVGLITRIPQREAEAQLQAMLAPLRRERTCLINTWIDESAGLYLGCTIRRNSSYDGTPLHEEGGDFVLFFSGEEHSETDDARRLHLLRRCKDNPAFPGNLNGRFHGILTDRNRETITMFNDRFGLHRLYYHESSDAFYFAAELKAILSVRPELRKLHPRSLGEFISCGCVLENRTLFDRIHVLPPASKWVFRKGSLERKRYFEAQDWEQQESLQPESYYQQLQTVFASSLPKYFRGPQRIAMSLTGGLDSRLVMGWHKPAPGSLPCYSFGSIYRDSHDVRLAQRVANACRQPHHVIRLGSDFLTRFASYAERAVYLTDACVNVSRAADLYLNEQAAEFAPVRMTGNYGSEVLRGVRAFKPVQPMSGLWSPELIHFVRLARETYDQFLRIHPLTFTLFCQAPWHHFGLLALEETQVSLRSPYLDNDLLRTLYRAPNHNAGNEVTLRLLADAYTPFDRIRTDLGFAARPTAFMALSRQLVNFSSKAEYAYDYAMPHWLVRVDHLLSPLHLERLFLGRHKFSHFRIWYRNALAEYVRQMLLDPRTLSRPYVQRNAVVTIVREHLRGTGNYTTEIHQLLTLELLHRLFVDSPMPTARHAAPEQVLVLST